MGNNIFLSYRWCDREVAENFEAFPDAIEKITGLKVYWDRELRSGNFIIELMKNDISVDVFMPVVTKSYLEFSTLGGRSEDKDFCLFEYAVAVSEGKKIIPIFMGTSATIKTVSYEHVAEAAKRVFDANQTDEDLTILQQYLLSQNGITINCIAEESVLTNKDNLNSLIYETFCSSDKISFYKQYLEDEAKKLAPIRIFGDFDDSGLTLGNSYVPISFLRHLTGKEQKEKENRREITAPTDAGENTILANLENEKLAVIIGDSGQGKSSFVRHLTIQLADQAKQNGLSRELFFPMYFECKNIDRVSLSSYDKFWNELAEKAGLSRPALDAVMRFGKPLCIFDAMDEIPPDQMDALVDAIYKHIYIQNNKTAYFLFTSRPGQRLISSRIDMTLSNDSRTVVRRYSVKEFDESQRELYINNLARAKILNSDIINEFLHTLRNKETVISDYHSISRNPFMLFAIFSTYINGQDLPENRFDAINRVIDDVIERDLKKQDYSPIKKKNIKEILGAISCLFYQQRDIGKTPHASMQTPYDFAEKIYNLDDSDRDDRKLLNKYSEFFGKSSLLDENGFRHNFLASTYAAYYLLFLMKSKVKKEKSPLEVNDISSLKKDTDYWKGVTEALLCLIDRESEDSKTYIEPLIDELQNTETPDYDTLCGAVSQFVNHQSRGATLILSRMIERGCDGIMYGEQADLGFVCHKGVNPYEELFYYPAIYPNLQPYLSNLTTENKQGEELFLCDELIREVCALFSKEYHHNLEDVYNSRNSSICPDIIKRLADAADRRGRNIRGYVKIRNEEKKIGDYAFWYCTNLTNITIPDSVTKIGNVAFSGCTLLTNINVCDNNLYYSSTDGVLLNKEKTAIILCPRGKTGVYTIPDSVTKISNSAFWGCTRLTGITIPDSVTEISNNAFWGCTGLTGVTFSDSVTKIGNGAFSGCTSLTDINVCNNNPIYSSIDGVLFNKEKTVILLYPAEKTGSYTIPDSVAKIVGGAFGDCTGLTDINVCGNNPYYSSIDGVLFNKDKTAIILCPRGKTGAYTIPNSVTEIGFYAFCGCTGLTSITISDSVTKIRNGAFSGCTSLTDINVCNNNPIYSSIDGVLFNKEKTAIIRCPRGKTGVYTIPNSVAKIVGGAFGDCTRLTGITIPDSVTEISNSAFWGCTGLTDITIPDSVTEISNNAFWGCTGLTGVTISNSVTKIGNGVFSGCTSLTDINVCNNNPIYSSIDGVLFNKEKTVIIFCPEGKIGVYTIPNSVAKIVGGAFLGCTELTDINIPDSVRRIVGSFQICPNLTIHGKKGSYAEEYANGNNIPFAEE